jgi:anti-sigma regulatory factor (Ser/Thr protein kinase)
MVGSRTSPRACGIHRLNLSNETCLIDKAVDDLVGLGRDCRAIAAAHETQVSVALHEALLNAIIHGNLEVSSRLREEDGRAFEALVELRRLDPRFGSRIVRVECRVQLGEVQYVIADEGPGFDVSRLPDPTSPGRVQLCSGRGVHLMRTFMDFVAYNDRGNEVTLVKRSAACCGSQR